jgi:hypothetical protein
MTTPEPSPALLEAIAVTAELCGRVFSAPAARVFADDIAAYPEPQVLAALRKCRREVRGALTVQDVVSRLDDGRPGPDEAWASIPKDEAVTVVCTEEMAQALGIVQPLLDDGDRVGARFAFRDAYARLVAEARNAGRPVQWMASLGHDPQQRERAVIEAVEQGKLPAAHAQQFLPAPEANPRIAALLAKATQHLLGAKP